MINLKTMNYSINNILEQSNLKWIKNNTIFLTVTGSTSYGLNTPESDIDFKGIVIPPKEYFIGTNSFEQADSFKDVDCTIFNILKFLNLTIQNNPNMIEILWTEPEFYVIKHSSFQKILDNRDKFLCRNLRWRFSGYSISQIKRIERHYRWLNKDFPKEPPQRKDFELPEKTVIPKENLEAAYSIIQKKLDSWSPDFSELDPAMRINIENKITDVLTEICGASIYIEKSSLWKEAVVASGLDINFIELVKKEKEYEQKIRDWQHYQEWKKNRNIKRAAIEEKYGYDCFSDDTEFLTNYGWKKFDEINKTDKLATVFMKENFTQKQYLGIEYQFPSNKFNALYNGTMYHITGHHTDTLVTANHRMLCKKIYKSINENDLKWELEEVCNLPFNFDFLISPTPRLKNYSNKNIFDGLPIPPRAYMQLMGWYLSDGCMAFDADGDILPKSVRVSQKLYGKLSWNMARWYGSYKNKANASLYNYKRCATLYNPNVHIERILDVRHSEIVLRIFNECSFKEFKHIPRYVFNLSKKLMELLLIGMLKGDGTKHEHITKSESFIYYSKSKQLADDVQELALMCGWETSLYGPYKNKDQDGREIYLYHVHVRKIINKNKHLNRNNIKRIEVNNQRVVCFTVDNGTLITRRNGKIGIHGNCKNAVAVVRLMRMCEEILSTGKVIVKRPDREELLAIRNGAWTYDYLLDWAKKQDEKMNELYKTTLLPNEPDRVFLNNLCMEIIEDFLF